MRRPVARAAALAAVPLLLAAAGCSDTGRMDHGTVFADNRREITVKPGQTFSLHWKLSVVPGNDWKAVPPTADPSVVSFIGEDRIAGDQSHSGDGGNLYLVFRAGTKGSTKLALDNCFTCTGALKDTYHSPRTYAVTVG
ncbi:hypothetical protein [Kitasatospora sp. GP82]|uniref:hypothetical protein n=1 Tax=Kitasatospora sp. GP82 TaxID=3035089 RepID=UPI0024770907|nr:hypothetical protein [Kitasatospora sp. GP82]MDH6130278.1 hypothetical protein [Kitasatospora sp. GP82]